MPKGKFIYVTYIATTPEKVWAALVEPKITHQYWGHENVSDWKVGSSWEHRQAAQPKKVRIIGKVVDTLPTKRLVLTWALPDDVADEKKYTRVTFDIEAIEQMVRLTVTHDQLEEQSSMHQSIAEGWPRVLSSMKSLLETGQPLDTWAGQKG